jgi:hypothetical protein
MLQVLVELCTKHQDDTVINSDFVTVHTLSVQNPKIQMFIAIITKAMHRTHIWSNISQVCVTSVSSSHRFLYRFSYTLCDSAVRATSVTPWLDCPTKFGEQYKFWSPSVCAFIHSNITYALLEWIISHDISAVSLNCNFHHFLPHIFALVFITLWFWWACCMFHPSSTP